MTRTRTERMVALLPYAALAGSCVLVLVVGDRLPSAPLYLSLTGIGPDCFCPE